MRRTLAVVAVLGAALALTGCFGSPVSLIPGETATSTAPTETTTPTPTATETTPTAEPTETEEPDDRTPVTLRLRLAEFDTGLQELHVSIAIEGTTQEGGLCTLTATDDEGDTVTAEQQPLFNVSRLECGGLRIPVAELHSGTWTVAVAYESETHVGETAPTTVEVP